MDIIVKNPVITEKSMKMADKGIYTFVVASSANKPQIAKFVAEKFNVQVVSVKTVNVKGKTKMQRRVRGTYQTSGYKKAMVQVGKGQKIGIFEATDIKSEAEVTTVEGDQIIKEKKNMLRQTKVKVEKIADVPMQTTQRKVITGK